VVVVVELVVVLSILLLLFSVNCKAVLVVLKYINEICIYIYTIYSVHGYDF